MILKLRGETRGDHVHLDVFSGPFESSLAHCGKVTLTRTEFDLLRNTLEVGEDTRPDTYEHVSFEVTP